ncbi:hypothetical protein JB92DRAFT_2962762, partial [Gautieria morchelliformis]
MQSNQPAGSAPAPVSAHSYAHVSASATDGAYSCSPSPYGGASDHAGMGSASTSAALGPSTSAAEAYAFGNAYAHAPQPSAYGDPSNRSIAPSTAAVTVSHSSMYSLLPMDVAMSAYEQGPDTGAQPAHEWTWPPAPAPSANRTATSSTATASLPRSRLPPAAPAPETVQGRDRGGRPGAILAPYQFPAVPVDGATGAGVGAYNGHMDVRPAGTNLRGGGAVASGRGSGAGRGLGG